MPAPTAVTRESDPRAFLGEELARARVAAGFASQQALADRLGFDRSVIGKAESGGRPPTPVLHNDAVPEGHTTEERSLVRRAGVAFERIRGYAMPRAQSRDLILEVASERWKQ
jgi:helix-turn-helix protein